MPYITTNHRFIIDDKHPADVFDEMEQFFSLYTVAIDDLQQVSVQLSVPASFDVTANKKLAESYRQFTKSLKYTIPDIHILPIKTAENSADNSENNGENDDDSDKDDNTLTLLIQRLDGYALEEDEKPSLYQSVLGKIMPRFGGQKSDTGLYPEREQISIAPTIATPAMPSPQALPPTEPVQVPVQIPVPTPVPPQPTPVVQPTIQPTQPTVPPVQPTYQSPQSQPQNQPQYQNPYQPPVSPVQQPIQTPSQTLQRLPNIAKSAKPYQEILTQAIVNEAKKQAGVLNGQIIQQITLKSSDSLTTAMIEQLFHSFNHAHEPPAPHDAIDLVSYGYEVLKPKLAELGVTLADDAGFGLKTNAKATPADTARLQSGGVFANEINLRVSLKNTANSPTIQTAQASQPTTPTANPAHTNQNLNANLNPNLNRNAQNIRLLLKASDPLGERQQKVSQFPLQFVSSDTPTHSPNADGTQVRIFGAGQGHFFDIVELDGNVLLGNIEPSVVITRNNQRLTSQTVLMPNDVLMVDIQGKIVSVTVALP